jgi:hypothetical protein
VDAPPIVLAPPTEAVPPPVLVETTAAAAAPTSTPSLPPPASEQARVETTALLSNAPEANSLGQHHGEADEHAEIGTLQLAPSEQLHLEFAHKRKQAGAVIEVDLSAIEDLWPPAAIAVAVLRSTGDLHNTERRYVKSIQCTGVLYCPRCDHRKRPIVTQLSSQPSINCPKCTTQQPPEMLVWHRCPGRFSMHRPKNSSTVTLKVEVPCNDHRLPPKVRQTSQEKKRFEASEGRTPADAAGIQSSDLTRKRRHRLKKAKGLHPRKRRPPIFNSVALELLISGSLLHKRPAASSSSSS